MKVLFMIPHHIEAASNRYRVYQYLPYLHAHGIETTVRPFVDSSGYYRLLYRRGHLVQKFFYTLRSMLRRFKDLGNIRKYDLIFVQREAFPFGPAWVEGLIARQERPIVFDFDDAVYLPNISAANRWLNWLKQPQKTADMIRMSTQVIAGNDVLFQYAQRYNPRVSILPTCIDTDYYSLRAAPPLADSITIGWVGGHTTLQYLHSLDGVFQQLAQQYPIRLRVVGGEYQVPGVAVTSDPWKLENELSDLHSFDIGVMPMPDNEWTRGKCGFKALQYMGVGIPAVASPVGANTQIISHGDNGFLANSDQEWIKYLSMLIENPSLRQKIGRRGRNTVEERYSLQVNAPKLLDILHSALLKWG